MIHFERKKRRKRNTTLGYALLTVCFILLTVLCIVRQISVSVSVLSAAMVGLGVFFLIREMKKQHK